MNDKKLMETSIVQGVKSRSDAGSVGGVNAYLDDDELPTVILATMPKDGESTRVYLHEGDTYELGAELWQVTEIKRPNSPRWVAILTQLR